MGINHVDATCHDKLQEIAKALGKAKKIVVVTGAGISTACGIPDFRSTNGLYSMMAAEHDAKLASRSSRVRAPKGKELFDSNVWNDSLRASTFCAFIASFRRQIREDVKKTSQAHKLIRQLRDRKKLVRCYTQNIDGLEAREGLCVDLTKGKGERTRFSARNLQQPHSPGSRFGLADGGCEVVQLHGDLAVLRCQLCLGHCAWDEREATILRGEAPSCEKCLEQDRYRRRLGKRGTKVGTLRPNVVLYGESHPDADMLSTITEHDLSLSPDILLILGTSLQVHGLKTLVREFAKSVHAKKRARGRVVFVNLTGPAQSVWKGVIDDWVEMDCDAWADDLKSRQPDMFLQQSTLAPKVAKSSKAPKQRSKKASLDTAGKENIEPASKSIESADKENMEPGRRANITDAADPVALHPHAAKPPNCLPNDRFRASDNVLRKRPRERSTTPTPPSAFLSFQPSTTTPTPTTTRPSPAPSSRKRKAPFDADATPPDLCSPRRKRTKRNIDIFDEEAARSHAAAAPPTSPAHAPQAEERSFAVVMDCCSKSTFEAVAMDAVSCCDMDLAQKEEEERKVENEKEEKVPGLCNGN